jgi:hypothetical protein
MSVNDSRTVDAIGVDKTSGEAVLTVTDHRAWNDAEHLGLLQDKLNMYLAFTQSGEILESYPDARGRAIRIDVVCKFEPDKLAEEFLLRARTIVRDAGLALTWRVPNSAMHATCEDARA